MGRPLNPRYLGDPAQSGFQVTGSVLVDVGEGVENGDILRQRSNNRYLVEGNTSTEQLVCKLVEGVPQAVGEMSVLVYEGSLSLIASQDETGYDGVGDNGPFTAGTGYSASDVITLSNGATITVDAINAGAVTEFTVTSLGDPVVAGVALTQASVDPAGGTGFTLTPDVDNLSATVAGYARNINNRTVKTFDGAVLSWPTSSDVSTRTKANLQGS